MKIVVIGGTGLIGNKVVMNLTRWCVLRSSSSSSAQLPNSRRKGRPFVFHQF